MTSQPVTQATTLVNRLTTLKKQITVHNKLIARFVLPIAATAYTDATAALEAVVHAPLKPLIEELQSTAVTMSPRPFAKAVLERYQDQVNELQQLQATKLDTYPDLSTATAVQYVSVQQRELVQKCFRFVLELLSMLGRLMRSRRMDCWLRRVTSGSTVMQSTRMVLSSMLFSIGLWMIVTKLEMSD
jgi:hypothetical protein